MKNLRKKKKSPRLTVLRIPPRHPAATLLLTPTRKRRRARKALLLPRRVTIPVVTATVLLTPMRRKRLQKATIERKSAARTLPRAAVTVIVIAVTTILTPLLTLIFQMQTRRLQRSARMKTNHLKNPQGKNRQLLKTQMVTARSTSEDFPGEPPKKKLKTSSSLAVEGQSLLNCPCRMTVAVLALRFLSFTMRHLEQQRSSSTGPTSMADGYQSSIRLRNPSWLREN
mmetsp:Transcript_39905/g.96284  ORF Transcript_39905/g.96284 Transcript_39905/m.96284 type:complete len:227 (-) Transcript_39905:657-1337(-)